MLFFFMRFVDGIAEISEFLRDGILDYLEYRKTEAFVRNYFCRLRRLNSFETPLASKEMLDAMSEVSEFERNRKAYQKAHA